MRIRCSSGIASSVGLARTLAIVAFTLPLAFLASPSHADQSKDWADCKGDDAKASLEACTRLLKGKLSSGDKASALGNRGWSHNSLGEYDAALSDYQDCVKIAPKDTLAFCITGVAQSYDYKEQYDDAVAQADKAIEADPKYSRAYVYKGYALNEKSLYDNAIEQYDKALQIDPRYTFAFYKRGQAYSNKDDYEKAAADYSKALLIDPTYNDARGARGYANLYLGKLDKAMSDIEASVKATPKDSWSLAVRGMVHMAQGDMDKAVTDLNSAIDLSPKTAWYHTQRGLAFMKQKKFKEAKDDFDSVIKDYPNAIEANAYLGQAFEGMGDKDNAKKAYRTSLANNASSADQRKAQQIALDALSQLDPQ